MPEARLGGRRLACLAILSALALLPGLGSSGRLTYHEAFVAQAPGRSSIQASGDIPQSAACRGWKNLHCHGGWSLCWRIAPAR